MKKTNIVFASLICLGLVSLSSCSCSPKRNGFGGEQYPSSPVEGQRYTDSNGNSSIWNAALGCWMISSMMNGRSVQHHYYPSTGNYTNAAGQTVSRPSTIPAPASRSAVGNSSSSVNSRSTTTTPAKSAGFGSTGRGSSSAS